MSPHVVSASEESSLGEIATLLEKHRIKGVPVIQDAKRIGIGSRSNLIQALASSLQAELSLLPLAANPPTRTAELWSGQWFCVQDELETVIRGPASERIVPN